MPPKLRAVTRFVSPDEKCLALIEVNLMRPNGRGIDRYQIIYVKRGEALAEYRQNLGPREKFIGAEFRLIGGIHHKDGSIELIETVGHLQELADDFRFTKPFVPDPLPLTPGQRLEQAIHWATAPSVSGKYVRREHG